MESGVLRHSNSTTPFHHPHLHCHPLASTFTLRFPSLSSLLPPLCVKYAPGTPDSGAERIHSRNFSRHLDGEGRSKVKKQWRRWWSDDGPSEREQMAPGVWEEFIDSMWFFKVLGSYGWMSPIIILSWLLASGPKACLMSFSIPFGLSVLTFVFKKLLGGIQSSAEYEPMSRKRSGAMNLDNLIKEDEQEIQMESKQRTCYQSNSVESRQDGSLNSNGAPGFGGWDDLIDGWELETRQAQKPTRATDQTGMLLEERMREMKRRVEGKRDLPLLLRLLVAVFPFLSSWTDLL